MTSIFEGQPPQNKAFPNREMYFVQVGQYTKKQSEASGETSATYSNLDRPYICRKDHMFCWWKKPV